LEKQGVDDDGRLYTWQGFTSAKPLALKFPMSSVGVKTVSLGRSHGALLTVNRQLFMFGNNDCSQLGMNSDSTTVAVPRLLCLPTGIQYIFTDNELSRDAVGAN